MTRPPSSAAEAALGIVLQFIDPKTSIAPLKLMHVNKYFHNLGQEWGMNNIQKYLTRTTRRSYESGRGQQITQHADFPDALYSLVRHRLPENLGNHGPSYTFAIPVNMEIVGEDNNALLFFDTCREYRRRQWRCGKLHGTSVTLHTCDSNANVREVQVYTYSEGLMHGVSFSLYVSPLPDMHGRVQIIIREYVSNTVVHSKEGVVTTAYYTREWNGLCGEHADLVRSTYEKYFVGEQSYIRIFLSLIHI